MMHEFKFEVENFHSNSIPILNYKKTKSSPEVRQSDRQLSLSLPTNQTQKRKRKAPIINSSYSHGPKT
jgi:hypothetical protein